MYYVDCSLAVWLIVLGCVSQTECCTHVSLYLFSLAHCALFFLSQVQPDILAYKLKLDLNGRKLEPIWLQNTKNC